MCSGNTWEQLGNMFLVHSFNQIVGMAWEAAHVRQAELQHGKGSFGQLHFFGCQFRPRCDVRCSWETPKVNMACF